MRTQELSYIAPRNVRSIELTAQDADEFANLAKLGIDISPSVARSMAAAFAQDAIEPIVTTASIATPVQFLQNWLPGFARVMTAARKIDEVVGIVTAGSWEDEEIVQGVMELTGGSLAYTDNGNIPLSNWNTNFERRTVVRFEEGMMVGNLEEARASKMRVNSAEGKREAAALALEIRRNQVGFYGWNSGAGRTYGFLNDPALPAYGSISYDWKTGAFLEITASIREMFATLRSQSQDIIDPETTPTTLAVATNCVDYLTVTSDFGISVRDWLTKTYPKCRVVSAPELVGANGGADVAYLYAEVVNDSGSDDNRTFVQVVPAKFKVQGVEKRAKGYLEDYSNATAGVMCKRPYAVVRRSGL